VQSVADNSWPTRLEILISRQVNDPEIVRAFVNKTGHALPPRRPRGRPHPHSVDGIVSIALSNDVFATSQRGGTLQYHPRQMPAEAIKGRSWE
jgi:hypothetical protein